MMRNLAIDPERLWGEIHETAAIGGTAKGGICRLTLSDLDRQVRDWFRARAEQLGCRVTVDDMGAMFARRAGTADVPPIAIGSHLDTQPTGGKFDGVLGVLGALEALRTLVEAGYETYAPIEVVNWTNEEGSRFAPAMVASGVFAKVFDRDWAHARTDRAGQTFGGALDAIGYRGTEPCGEHPLSAFFELHIEQGPILEAEGADIGVVTGAQAISWYDVTLTGQDAHSGTTPMHRRKNALLGAARVIEAVDRIGHRNPPGVATVGMIENRPNSRNVIPGGVFLTVDLRHPDDGVVHQMRESLYGELREIAEALKLDFKCEVVAQQAAVQFHPDCIAAIRRAAEVSGCTTRDIVSGAGHDAVYLSRVSPTAMIFVPCRDGISHNEIEFTSKEQCAKGAQVLLQAVLEFDRGLAERRGNRP
jgi:N-carbamoyl-L-amino-acid hydrolase